MAHAGTMDLGGSTRTKQSGSRWPAVMLPLAVVVATIAAVWFASSAGLVGGTATKPVADRSFDQVGAQGVIALSAEREAYLDGIFDRAHAAPYISTVGLPDNLTDRRGYAVEVQSTAALSAEREAYLNGIFDRAHAAPYISTVGLPDNLSDRRGYAVETRTAP